MATTRVYINTPRPSARGPRYDARLGSPDGELLFSDSKEPLLDAARVLRERGITGRAELWDSVRNFPRISGEIPKLARRTVREDETTSPLFARWRPFPAAREGSKTAKSRSEVGREPRHETAAGEKELQPHA